MFDLLDEIRQTLANNRLRTFLTGISVAWGIFMLIILVSMSRGVFNAFQGNMNETTTATINIYSGRTSMAHQGFKEGRRVMLDVRDMAALVEACPEMISEVHSAISVDSAKLETLTDYTQQGMNGVFPGSNDLRRLKVIAGRTINRADNDTRRRVVMMESRNAELLFGSVDNAVGQTVKALGVSWTVVGVFQHDWARTNYVPFNTLLLLAKGGDTSVWQLTVIAPGMKDEADGEALEKEIRSVLASQHSFSPDDSSAVYIYNQLTNYLSSARGLGYLDIAIWVIGILTMLSGIIGVSNIMFVSVRERTHEIGIRRAIGAKPRQIMLQIVAESVVITTLFGYIGVVMGIAVTTLIASVVATIPDVSQAISNPTVDISIAVKVTIVLILSGALAGLAPALKATKVKPVEALRDE